MAFLIKKSQFSEMSRFKESKGTDSLNRDFTAHFVQFPYIFNQIFQP